MNKCLKFCLFALLGVAQGAQAASDYSYWSNNAASSFSNKDDSKKEIIITSESELARLAVTLYKDHTSYNWEAHGYEGWTVKLDCNLDLSEHYWNYSIGGNQVGDAEYKFLGTFDGQGHTITGMNNLRGWGEDKGYYVGIFGMIGTTATVRNLIVDNSNLVSSSSGGCIVGLNEGLVENCYVTESVSLTAKQDYSNNLGLIVGNNKGTVRGCVAAGKLTEGEHTGGSALGGIVGYNNGGTLEDNLFIGQLEASNSAFDVGGIAGSTEGGTLNSNLYVNIPQGYNTYYTAPTTDGKADTPAYSVSTAAEDDNIYDYGGDCLRSYDISKIYIYPYGFEFGTVFYHHDPRGHITFSGGTGTEDDPYLISNDEDWNDLARATALGFCYKGVSFQQTADITATVSIGPFYGRNTFKGTYDGGEYTLTLALGSADSYVNSLYCAPFSYINASTIKNLIVDGDIYTSSKCAGSLIGINTGGETTVSNCLVKAAIHSNVNGEGDHGGYVGVVEYGSVSFEGCRFSGSFIGTSTKGWGGFVGYHGTKSIDGKVKLTRCVFEPAGISVNSDDCATFVRNGAETATDIFYTTSLGTVQGEATLPVTCGTEGCSIALLGIDKQYTVSDLSFASDGAGFLIGDEIRAINSKVINFSLSIPDNYDYLKVFPNFGSVGATDDVFSFTYTYPATANGDTSVSVSATLVPVTEPQGEGTQGNPYLISSTNDWNQLAARMNRGEKYSGKYFAMTNDITATTPLGNTATAPFGGVLDGQSHTLTFNIEESEPYTAPIRYIDGAELSNLTVKGNIVGGKSSAGLVGFICNSGEDRIEHCHVTASISGGIYSAGLVGTIRSNSIGESWITDCRVSGSVIFTGEGSTNPRGGGIVGHAGSASVSLNVVGCMFDGKLNVQGPNYGGAIVGWCDSPENKNITDCLENGSYYITQDNIGFSLCNGNFSAFNYTNCYQFNTRCQGAKYPYRIYSATDDLELAFYQTPKTYQVAGFKAYEHGVERDGLFYGGDKDDIYLKLTTPDGLDFELECDPNYNKIEESGDYYILHINVNNNSSITATFKPKEWENTGDGTEASPYLIYNTMQFDKFASEVNAGNKFAGKVFKIMADLTYDGTTNNFKPIGRLAKEPPTDEGNTIQFQGTLDGGGHTISGINMTYEGTTYDNSSVGLFGYFYRRGYDKLMVIKNLTISNSKFTGFNYVGAFLGYNNGAQIENCHVASDVIVAAVQDGATYHGGIVGYNINDGNVYGCTSAASVTAPIEKNTSTSKPTSYSGGEFFGGIVGYNNAKVYNCLYLGPTVQGNASVGAIIGESEQDYINFQQRNFYRGILTYYGPDQSRAVLASEVGMGKAWNGAENKYYYLKDYDGAKRGFRRVSKPDNIGAKVTTYGVDDYVGIVAYENGLYYDGGYYTSEQLPMDASEDNSAIIEANQGDVDVVLTGRTLKKDGKWNTLCLPFTVTSAQMADDSHPLYGASVRTLRTASFDEATNTLMLFFTTNDMPFIPAGTPFIVKWSGGADIVDPVFNAVNVSSTQPTDITGEAANMCGIYSAYNTNDEDKTVFYLGDNNKFHYPSADMTVSAFSAIFKVASGLVTSNVMDLSNDGKIDMADVNLLVDHLLGKSTYNGKADINDNGTVSVADVTTLVDFILNNDDDDKTVIKIESNLTEISLDGGGSGPARSRQTGGYDNE